MRMLGGKLENFLIKLLSNASILMSNLVIVEMF